MKKETVSITLPRPILQKVREAAKKEKRTVSAQLELLAEQYFEKYASQPIQEGSAA